MKIENLRPYATRFLIILIAATFLIAAANEIVFLATAQSRNEQGN